MIEKLKEGEKSYSLSKEFTIRDLANIGDILDNNDRTECFLFMDWRAHRKIDNFNKNLGLQPSISRLIVNTKDFGLCQTIQSSKYSYYIIPIECLEHPAIWEINKDYESGSELFLIPHDRLISFVDKIIAIENYITKRLTK